MASYAEQVINANPASGHGQDWGMEFNNTPSPVINTPVKATTKPAPRVAYRSPSLTIFHRKTWRVNAWTFKGEEWI